MPQSVRVERRSALLNRVEDIRGPMAKADLNLVEKVTEDQARERFGAVLQRAVALSGMTDKEACAALGAVVDPDGDPIDKGQFSRWLSGKENCHMWRWYRVPRLRDALRAMEAIDAGLRVRTVIEDDRRSA
jgi:hypothetical protein